MPIYEIEQYELHTQKYQVQAASKAEAIKRLFAGEADAVDNSMEFVEVADDYGLPIDECRDLAEELNALGEIIGDEVIPSIRNIFEVEE